MDLTHFKRFDSMRLKNIIFYSFFWLILLNLSPGYASDVNQNKIKEIRANVFRQLSWDHVQVIKLG